MSLPTALLCGAFLCNAIPHLAAGLRGEGFPTPFARPRGIGMSSPGLNFLWGTSNLLAGLWLGSVADLRIGMSWGFAAALAGFVLLGLRLSRRFGKVRRGELSPIGRVDPEPETSVLPNS